MSTEHKHPEWGAYAGPGGSWEGSAGHPSEFYDTARSLFLADCPRLDCDGTAKLIPDGNQWEVACGACGATGAQGGSPAIAAKNWNTLWHQAVFAKPEKCA